MTKDLKLFGRTRLLDQTHETNILLQLRPSSRRAGFDKLLCRSIDGRENLLECFPLRRGDFLGRGR